MKGCPLVLEQHTWIEFDSAISLKQQTVGRHVAPLCQYYSDSQPTSIFVLTLYNDAYLAEKKQIPV